MWIVSRKMLFLQRENVSLILPMLSVTYSSYDDLFQRETPQNFSLLCLFRAVSPPNRKFTTCISQKGEIWVFFFASTVNRSNFNQIELVCKIYGEGHTFSLKTVVILLSHLYFVTCLSHLFISLISRQYCKQYWQYVNWYFCQVMMPVFLYSLGFCQILKETWTWNSGVLRALPIWP